MPQIAVQPVRGRRDLRAFVRFSWRVYQGDPNWVPPLISEQYRSLDPGRSPFFQHAEVVLLLARRGREVVGTIAAFVDHDVLEHLGKQMGGFGFFEVVRDYAVAARLLDTAAEWLRERGVEIMHGPMNLSKSDHAGFLVSGADCPPVMLESHSPPYYVDFVERYGMTKYEDLYAYRAFRSQVGEDLGELPADLARVAEAAYRISGATVRKIRLDNWDQEVGLAHHLFNDTLTHMPDHVPMPEAEFRRMAGQLRPFIDPNLALVAEADGKAVGFCVAVPDINRVLIRLNGRLFPFNWLRLGRLVRQVDVVTFKLMGVLESYRMRGIDALLYLEILRGFVAGGYEWLDGSVTSEYNVMVNLAAQRLGAERYKHFRLYQLTL